MELICCNKWTQLICMLILTCLLKIAQSCSCYPKHPQQHFCQSGFAIRATILESHVVWPTADHIVRDGAVSLSADVVHSTQRAYEVHVKQVFKGEIMRNQIIYLYTPYKEMLCGISGLEKGTEYLFMGSFDKVSGKHSLNLCQYHHKWSQVSEKQVEGLLHGYKNNCDATIAVCGIDVSCRSGEQNKIFAADKESIKEPVCIWDPWKGMCEQLEAICKIHRKSNRTHWDLSPDHHTCLANLYPGM